MNNSEISQLLQDAKDASIKVISEEEVTPTDLESIYKVVNINQNKLWENLSSGMESIKNRLVESIESAADIVLITCIVHFLMVKIFQKFLLMIY